MTEALDAMLKFGFEDYGLNSSGETSLSCQNFNNTKFSLDQPGCSLFHLLTPKLDSSEGVQMKDHKVETQIRNIFDAMICVIQISDWEWWPLFCFL